MDRTLRLNYGSGKIQFRLPEERVAATLGMDFPRDGEATESDHLKKALEGLKKAGLPGKASGKSVAVLLSDATRSEPHEDLARAVLPLIRRASRVSLVVCTGTHDADSDDNVALASRLDAVSGEDWGVPVETHVHDCVGEHNDKGKTTGGTRVEFDSFVDGHEVFLAVSDMKPHYFAGYSNPIKNFVPGVASFETVRSNHSLALDRASTSGRHPWHPDPERREQPLAEDLEEAFELALEGRPAYALALVTHEARVVFGTGGLIREATQSGIKAVDRMADAQADPEDVVVISCGGYPNDESLYTAQRALELSRMVFRKGATIFLLAECRNGLGPRRSKEHFYDLLTQERGLIHKQENERYELYSHKAIKLVQMLDEVGEIRLVSSLNPDLVKAIHLTPEPDPQKTVRELIQAKPDARVIFIDDANSLTVRAGPQKGSDRA